MIINKFVVLSILLISAEVVSAGELNTCLPRLAQTATRAGVSPDIIDRVIPALRWQNRVIELDRSQPEFTQTFAQYLNARVSHYRIEKGRELYQEYRPLLDRLTRIYGIPGRYLVAFWGMETNFGNYLGKMSTLDSLATLACDTRRADYFTSEFIAALQLLEREQLHPEQLKGSWAGAMGHTQFMPSSYLRYAKDGDKNGQINLWDSVPDAFASSANFLKQLGWQSGERWGREVLLPESFNYGDALSNPTRPLIEWANLGVRLTEGRPLPQLNLLASFKLPAGHSGPAFLVYRNFDAILGWNRSEFYALSVGHLADRIIGGGDFYVSPPADQNSLDRDKIKQIQLHLHSRGYATGLADGILGPATRSALAIFQQGAGLISDGYPDNQTISRLLASGATDAR